MKIAWDVLVSLLQTSAAGQRSVSSSVKQQLQQSGMLQQFAAVMTAMAADLQAAAAALAARNGDAAAAKADLEQLVADTPHPVLKPVMAAHRQMTVIWGCDAEAVSLAL